MKVSFGISWRLLFPLWVVGAENTVTQGMVSPRKEAESVSRHLAAPQECREGTIQIQNNFGLQEASTLLQEWFDSIEAQGGFCTNPTDDKTACVIDYDPDLSGRFREACLNAGGAYVTMDYVYKCTDSADKQEFFYTQNEHPECYHFTCSNTDDVEELAEEVSDAFMSQNLQPETNMECQRLRLRAGELEIQEGVQGDATPEDCLEDSVLLMAPVANETEELQREVALSIEESCLIETGVNGNQNFECQAEFSQKKRANKILTDHYCSNELGGVYLEIGYTVRCSNTGGELTVYAIGDPYCVSKSLCSGENFDYLASQKANKFAALLPEVLPQWNECEVSYTRVENFAASAAPSSSQMPSSSPAPSLQPTSSPAPSTSYAPTKEQSCLEGSESVNETQTIQDVLWEIDQMVYENSTSSFCLPQETGSDSSVTCEFDSSGFGDQLLKETCANAGGLYVEEIYTVDCDGNGTKTSLNYINKPACRYQACNALELKETLRIETSWIQALGNRFVNPNAARDETEKCFLINARTYVGGNVDGGASDISDECMDQSTLLGTTISIYNEKRKLQKAFNEYTSVDLRQLCASIAPGRLQCEFDWTQFENQIEPLCSDADGQYLESGFETVCSKEDKTYYLRNRNVPGCLGVDCPPGESELYLPTQEHDWLAKQYELDGWSCETHILDIYTPNYVRPEDRPEESFTNITTEQTTQPPLPALTLFPTSDADNTIMEDVGGGIVVVVPPEPTAAPVEKRKYGGALAAVLFGIITFVGIVAFLLWRRSTRGSSYEETSRYDEEAHTQERGRSRKPKPMYFPSVASNEETVPAHIHEDSESNDTISWHDEPPMCDPPDNIEVDEERPESSITDDPSSSEESDEDFKVIPTSQSQLDEENQKSTEDSNSSDESSCSEDYASFCENDSSSKSSQDISVNTEDDSPKELV